MVFGEGSEHLGSSLRMSNEGKLLLSSLLKHVVNYSWQVILGKLIETEVEILLLVLLPVSFEPDMTSTIIISSVVTHPYIITLVSKNESEGFISHQAPSLR